VDERNLLVHGRLQKVTIPAKGTYTLVHKNITIRVVISKRSTTSTLDSDVVELCGGLAQKSVIEDVIATSTKHYEAGIGKNMVMVFTWNVETNQWEERLETLPAFVMKPPQVKDVLDYLSKSKNENTSRGVLLHGVTGTGKSTLAKLVAKENHRHVYKLPLQVKDNELNKLRSAIPPNTVVLIDDLDRIFDETAKDIKGSLSHDSFSLNKLLDFFDSKPLGAWVFVTTNNKTILDSIQGLTRPGRVDYNQEIKPQETSFIVECLQDRFGSDDPIADALTQLSIKTLTMAQLTLVIEDSTTWQECKIALSKL